MRRTMAVEARRLSTFIVRRPSRRPLACFCECVFGVHLGTPGVVFPAPNSPPWVPPSGVRVATLVLSNYNYNYNYIPAQDFSKVTACTVLKSYGLL